MIPSIDIEDPRFYIQDPWPTYAFLRNEAPAYFYEPLQLRVVSRFADVRQASQNGELFTSTRGVLLNDLRMGDGLIESFFEAEAKPISVVNGAEHLRLRRALAPSFTPRAVAAHEDEVRQFVGQLLDGLPIDEPFDFVAAVATPVPIWSVARHIGLPGDNIAQMKQWSDEIEKLGSATTRAEIEAASRNVAEVSDYLATAIERKRTDPGDDLISTLLQLPEPLTDAELLTLVSTVLLGGNETTRALLGSALHLLVTHEEQFELAREDPGLAAAVVEEALRCTPPVNGFVRTATRETVVGETSIGAGERVYLLYPAANRDERVYDDPDRFDVLRRPAVQHLAFGFGPHACPGTGLARMEMILLLEEFFARGLRVELAGSPRYLQSVLRYGFESLPVRLHR